MARSVSTGVAVSIQGLIAYSTAKCTAGVIAYRRVCARRAGV
ncbi:hypothetical protein MPHL43070_03740 [Mycolicibacterium phlei DSM 43070]|nr:hypothetical protein MPHL43070_03740 [Mycolicibacterium phlei DSM 43070]